MNTEHRVRIYDDDCWECDCGRAGNGGRFGAEIASDKHICEDIDAVRIDVHGGDW